MSDGRSWADLRPLHFDASLAPTARARRIAADADSTLFPDQVIDLLAAQTTKPASDRAAELDGQADLFGGDL